jgi:hypothetical protein
MKNAFKGLMAVGVVSLVSACASAPPPTTTAAGVERRQCDASATAQDGLVRSTRVLAVEPIYSHVMTSRSNSEERVSGAKLLVRPPQGVSAEDLTRILQCHSARILLGQVNRDTVPNDPYWLPDTWVNIDVKPEDGNFAITVRANSVDENLEVFSRANHYADDHAVAADPGLP